MSLSIRKMPLLLWSSGLSPSPHILHILTIDRNTPKYNERDCCVYNILGVCWRISWARKTSTFSPIQNNVYYLLYIQILRTYSLHVVEGKSFVTIACYKMPTERKVSSHPSIVLSLEMCLFSHLLTNGS